MSTRIISFKEAMMEAQEIVLKNDPNVILMGEGIHDPKAVFGTTAGLKEKFPKQVFDMPVSENGMTGVCIGAAINGLKPILVHMRIDFSLYSMDQLVNNAAKWFSMYGGQKSVPLVIRMLIGRGWGQGNQHSQNLTAIFAHVPGLKIVVPSNAADAKALFISAVNDPNPVLFIEHRWLYETTSEVPEGITKAKIGKACYARRGDEVTLVASGHAVKECLLACEYLEKQGVSVDLIDLMSIKPLNIVMIIESVRRTGRLVVIDDAWSFCGLAGEIIAQVAESNIELKAPPVRLTYPDYPSGSSPALTKHYYVGPYDIASAVRGVCGRLFDLMDLRKYQEDRTHDVPDKNFRGPF